MSRGIPRTVFDLVLREAKWAEWPVGTPLHRRAVHAWRRLRATPGMPTFSSATVRRILAGEYVPGDDGRCRLIRRTTAPEPEPSNEDLALRMTSLSGRLDRLEPTLGGIQRDLARLAESYAKHRDGDGRRLVILESLARSLRAVERQLQEQRPRDSRWMDALKRELEERKSIHVEATTR